MAEESASEAEPTDDTIRSMYTPEVRKALRKARAFAAEGRWRRLILSLPKINGGGEHPVLTFERLRAAIELGDDAEIGISAEIGLQFSDCTQRLKLASCLVTGNQPDRAWALIESLPSDASSKKISKIVRRIVLQTKNNIIREKAESRINFGIAELPATSESAEFRFLGDSDEFDIADASVNLIRLNNAPKAIEDRVKNIWSDFDLRLSQKEFPCIQQYNNVFLNEIGQIWSEKEGLIKSRGLPMPNHDYSKEVPTFGAAFSCVRESKGYYEWIASRLATLSWRLQPDTPNCTILLRKEHYNLAVNALTPMEVDPNNIVSINDTVFCHILYVGTSSLAAQARRNAYQHSYGRLIELAAKQDRGDSPKLIYISRRDSLRRVMTNENEFEADIGALGFTPLVLSEINLLDKINLFRNAEVVIGAHGAGLSHLVFAKPGLRVVEIMPVTMNQYSHMNARVCFSLLSKALGLNHTMALHLMNPATSGWSADAKIIAGLV